MAIALLIRVRYNLALHPDGHSLSDFIIDEREYFGAAHVLAEGRGFSYFDTALWIRPPLYVTFLGAFIRLFGIDTWPVMVAQSLISALTLMPLGWLASRVGGLRAARWAVGLGAFYLPFTLFAGLLLSETLFVLLFALTLVGLIKLREVLDGNLRSSVLKWAALIGLFMGLSVLTRSTALGFLPLALFWLIMPRWRFDAAPRRIMAVIVTTVVCGLVILPWIVRNYVAYGQLVGVDTTAGYNLWLGSVGVRDEARLQADLRTLPNPVERETFAYAHAWENIRNDPTAFVRKGIKESFDLWLPSFSAEERQVKGFTLGRVDARHLAGLLVLDDILYVVILAFAGLGLLIAPASPLKAITLLWVLLWVAMSFVFFAVTRFRLPVVAALIPWAGTGVAALLRWPDFRLSYARLSLSGKWSGGFVIIALAILTINGIMSSLSDTVLGIQRWDQQVPYRVGEGLLKEGKPEQALARYKLADTGLADTRYGMAAAMLQLGDTRGALGQLRSDEPQDRFEPFILRGDAERRAGNLTAAQTLFNNRAINNSPGEALQWAWDHLNPPVVGDIRIGSGLDVGYIRGFYGAETDKQGRPFRWSAYQSEVRNLVPGGTARLTLSGWRPTNDSQTRLTVNTMESSGQAVILNVNNSPDWEMLNVSLNSGPATSSVISISADPFVPVGSDSRLVSVRVAEIDSTR